jgi:hypothetical protein
MKFKTTLLFFTILGVGAFIGYPPKPTTATGATNITPKNIVDDKLIAYCPVVGTGNNTQTNTQNDQDGLIYKHCTKCETGAYLLHKEGNQSLVSKCTFCGALEENQEISSISGE